MKTSLLSAAFLALYGVVSAALAAGDAEQGRLRAQTCMGCHGAPGMRNAYPGYRVPKLGGQHAQYLMDALKAYQQRTRSHPTMQAQAADLSDQDMANIAAYFSQLGKPAGK
ncbi:MAG: cytochrome c [Gammaproteobacteria bacterium]|nr:cytochrome c [Gammaproteobacteria bacterium]